MANDIVSIQEAAFIIEGYRVSFGTALTYLHELKKGGCWCEMGTLSRQDLFYAGIKEHSKLCKEIKELLDVFPKTGEYEGMNND